MQAEISGIRRVGYVVVGDGLLVDPSNAKTGIRIVVRLDGQNESFAWSAVLHGVTRGIDIKVEDIIEATVD